MAKSIAPYVAFQIDPNQLAAKLNEEAAKGYRFKKAFFTLPHVLHVVMEHESLRPLIRLAPLQNEEPAVRELVEKPAKGSIDLTPDEPPAE